MEYERGLVAQYDAIHKRLVNGNGHSKKIIPLPTNPHPQSNVSAAALLRLENRIKELESGYERLRRIIAGEDEKPSYPRNNELRCLSVEKILQVVCSKENFRKAELISPRRDAEICAARHIVVYLCCKWTPKSLPQIGRRLGGRDHTTILHSFRKVEQLRTQDEELNFKLCWYEKELKRIIDEEIRQLTAIPIHPQPALTNDGRGH